MPPIYDVGDAAEVMRSDGSWSRCRVTEITADASVVVVMDSNGLSKTVPFATVAQYLRKTGGAVIAPAPRKSDVDTAAVQRIPTAGYPASAPAPAVADSATAAADDKDESESDDEDDDDSDGDGDEEDEDDEDEETKKQGGEEDEADAMKGRLSRKVSLGRRATVQVPAKAGLTERHVQALREVFGLFESEDDQGSITPSDVRQALADAGLESDSPEVWKMVAGFDTTDPIDFEEFVALIAEPLGDRRSRAGASRLLGLLGPSAVSEGSVGVDDLKAIASDLAIDLDEDDLLDMLEKAGVGADGRLTLDDFYSALQDPE